MSRAEQPIYLMKDHRIDRDGRVCHGGQWECLGSPCCHYALLNGDKTVCAEQAALRPLPLPRAVCS